MKNVRIWFKKDFECRYISHLDLNRCMLRALHKSKIPIWHTEGFNPHIYLTFALPLSLGYESEFETMDFRLTKDMDFEEVLEKLDVKSPDEETEATTLGGFVSEQLDRMPAPGDKLTVDGMEMEVTKATDKTVDEIKVTVLPTEDDEDD